MFLHPRFRKKLEEKKQIQEQQKRHEEQQKTQEMAQKVAQEVRQKILNMIIMKTSENQDFKTVFTELRSSDYPLTQKCLKECREILNKLKPMITDLDDQIDIINKRETNKLNKIEYTKINYVVNLLPYLDDLKSHQDYLDYLNKFPNLKDMYFNSKGQLKKSIFDKH